MYRKIIMAEIIEELSELPFKTQEAVLKNLSEQMIMQIKDLKIERAGCQIKE